MNNYLPTDEEFSQINSNTVKIDDDIDNEIFI